jgi:hypothetical protein
MLVSFGHCALSAPMCTLSWVKIAAGSYSDLNFTAPHLVKNLLHTALDQHAVDVDRSPLAVSTVGSEALRDQI